MNKIELYSEQELRNVVESNPCTELLAEQSFRKTRYIEQKEMDELACQRTCQVYGCVVETGEKGLRHCVRDV